MAAPLAGACVRCGRQFSSAPEWRSANRLMRHPRPCDHFDRRAQWLAVGLLVVLPVRTIMGLERLDHLVEHSVDLVLGRGPFLQFGESINIGNRFARVATY